MARSITEHISRRWLAGPLAIWGKLPSHGDFLRHRASAAQARDWQDWVTRVWSPPPGVSRARAWLHAEPGWVALEPRKVTADLTQVPVAFVMQPGTLPFSPRHCVQGVMVASQDQVGRPCPLVIFQQVAPGWLRRSWSAHPSHSQHDMLYWLARIAARTHGAERSWEALGTAVDALWQLHAPSWRQLLGAPLAVPSSLQQDQLLQQYCDSDTADAALGLHGVRRMPWLNWPAPIVRSEHPVQAFWQQDVRGGYVNASENLASLWGTRA
jgi:type VI secretion system protein ImpM